MSRDRQSAAGRGGIGHIRLVIEYDGLIQRFGRLVAEAAALIDRIARLRGEASDAAPSLELVIARFGDGDAGDLAAEVRSIGLEPLLDAAGARLSTPGAPASLGPADAGTGVMVFAGRADSAAAALAARMPAYLVSDRAPADHRQLAIVDAPRVVAEAMRLAVPRPIAPMYRTGAAIAIPARDAADARARGRAALAIDLAADWVTIGGDQLFYCPNGPLAGPLAAMPGARLLAETIRLDQFALARCDAAEVGGTAVFETGGYRIGALTGRDVLPWRNARRGHFGPPAGKAGGGGGSPSAPIPAASRDTVVAGDRTIALYRLPHADARSDDLFAILIAGGAEGLALAEPFAAALQARLGGAAILVAAGAADVEALVGGSLWEAERNCLAGAICIGSAPATPSADHMPYSASMPRFPIVTLDDHLLIEAMAEAAVRLLRAGQP